MSQQPKLVGKKEETKLFRVPSAIILSCVIERSQIIVTYFVQRDHVFTGMAHSGAMLIAQVSE